eukprot:CAMPEP_0178994010 /NCGR_PEP_ID=MMETSP0795-20121207/7036_1 /TAXON_ID=88552 /ORGANISM="Amoebophrya sp., Strain Ameob2" /LENGTH=328 /DNA_ID=CAMNT_0020686163 /DNA_START=82 /DNA_END=1068 /DNA_ORIENTATION=-
MIKRLLAAKTKFFGIRLPQLKEAADPEPEQTCRDEWNKFSKEQQLEWLGSNANAASDAGAGSSSSRADASGGPTKGTDAANSNADGSSGSSSTATPGAGAPSSSSSSKFAARMLEEQRQKWDKEKALCPLGRLPKRSRLAGHDPDSLISEEEAKKMRKLSAKESQKTAPRFAVPVFGKRAAAEAPPPPATGGEQQAQGAANPNPKSANGQTSSSSSSSSASNFLTLAEKFREEMAARNARGELPRVVTLADVEVSLNMPKLTKDSIFEMPGVIPSAGGAPQGDPELDDLRVEDVGDKRDMRTQLRDEVRSRVQEERLRAAIRLEHKNK